MIRIDAKHIISSSTKMILILPDKGSRLKWTKRKKERRKTKQENEFPTVSFENHLNVQIFKSKMQTENYNSKKMWWCLHSVLKFTCFLFPKRGEKKQRWKRNVIQQIASFFSVLSIHDEAFLFFSDFFFSLYKNKSELRKTNVEIIQKKIILWVFFCCVHTFFAVFFFFCLQKSVESLSHPWIIQLFFLLVHIMYTATMISVKFVFIKQWEMYFLHKFCWFFFSLCIVR